MDENNNIDFNSSDAIFIPKEIKNDTTDFTELKVGFCRKVPDKCALVKVNKYTGRVSLVNGVDEKGNYIGGYKFMFPFVYESIIIPVFDRVIDYPVDIYRTQDNIDAEVDIELYVKITNPVLYYREGRTQLERLGSITKSYLRKYILARDFDDINKGSIALNDPSVNGANEFVNFEKRYGIKVQVLRLKSIRQPENLRKLMDDKKENEYRQAAQKVENETRMEKAEAEAKIMGIGAEAEAKRIQTVEKARLNVSAQILSLLEDKNLSREQIAEILRAQMLKDSTNTVNIVGGSNGIGNNIAAGIIAGNRASNTRTNTNSVSNSDRLISDLTTYVGLDLYSEKSLANVRKALENKDFKSSIDNASPDKYQQIVNALLDKEKLNNNYTENGNNSYHR